MDCGHRWFRWARILNDGSAYCPVNSRRDNPWLHASHQGVPTGGS
jgi:hypothetical protein